MKPLCCAAALIALTACASKPAEEKKPVPVPAAPVITAAVAVPVPPPKPAIGDFGVDLSAGDRSVKPGDDFFEFANGSWDRSFAIPADKASFGPFDRLDELSKERVRQIIEKAAAAHAPNGTPEQQIGDYYAA
jgi:putative endopeptidase